MTVTKWPALLESGFPTANFKAERKRFACNGKIIYADVLLKIAFNWSHAWTYKNGTRLNLKASRLSKFKSLNCHNKTIQNFARGPRLTGYKRAGCQLICTRVQTQPLKRCVSCQLSLLSRQLWFSRWVTIFIVESLLFSFDDGMRNLNKNILLLIQRLFWPMRFIAFANFPYNNGPKIDHFEWSKTKSNDSSVKK